MDIALTPREPDLDPYDVRSNFSPDEPAPRFTFRPGSLILDEADRPAAWWGHGDDILAAHGEALMIAGPQGLGKSTIGQQLALGRCGFTEYDELFGLPITPGHGRVLYLAMDRPRQIARSMRRMVGEAWRDQLDQRLAIWTGPPPYDIAKYPRLLTQLAEDAGADTVVLDSLKDAAVGLTDDEAGAGYNRARQATLEAGVELLELHHVRKIGGGITRGKPTVDDIYGSTWLTAGAGSVLLLNGDPGDALVKLHHVKQPLGEVGPLTILHDNLTGRSTIAESVDLVIVARNRGKVTALEAAGLIFDTEKPSNAEKEKARRRLEALTRTGHLQVLDDGDKATNRPRMWGVA